MREALWAFVGVVALACALAAAPARAQDELPDTVSATRDLVYDPARGTKLDVYIPKVAEKSALSLPVVVWIHGGGWAGGSKAYIAPYAAALASCGYVVAAIDYALPPQAIYPTPVRQAFAALAYLAAEAGKLHLDPARIVLAGDSAGAQIAAQVANAATSRPYARRLDVKAAKLRHDIRGVALFSGAFDLATMKFAGPVGGLLGNPLAVYAGTPDFLTNPDFATFSVARYVTRSFPPAFVSAGNNDDFESQSRDFAERLKAKGVQVDTVFFPPAYAPPQPHVYQFDMKSQAGKFAFARLLLFLADVTAKR